MVRIAISCYIHTCQWSWISINRDLKYIHSVVPDYPLCVREDIATYRPGLALKLEVPVPGHGARQTSTVGQQFRNWDIKGCVRSVTEGDVDVCITGSDWNRSTYKYTVVLTSRSSVTTFHRAKFDFVWIEEYVWNQNRIETYLTLTYPEWN